MHMISELSLLTNNTKSCQLLQVQCIAAFHCCLIHEQHSLVLHSLQRPLLTYSLVNVPANICFRLKHFSITVDGNFAATPPILPRRCMANGQVFKRMDHAEDIWDLLDIGDQMGAELQS